MDEHLYRVVRMMNSVCPRVASDIREFYDEPVRAYAAHCFAEPNRITSKISNRYRHVVAEALRTQNQQLYGTADYDAMIDEHIARGFPLLTAPHCQLYWDPMAFWAFMLAWVGTLEIKRTLVPIFNTATVTLSSGAGFLATSAGRCNILNVGSSKLAKISVCYAPRDMRFNPCAFEKAADVADESERRIIKHVQAHITKEASDFADLTNRINASLMTSLTDKDLKILPFDEALVARVLITLIRTPDEIVWPMLFTETGRTRWKRAIEKVREYPCGVFISTNTELFWARRNNRICRLRLLNDTLIPADEDKARLAPIRLEPETIMERLHRSELIPGLFLCFLVISLLPQLPAIGGTRQIGYLEAFILILKELLDQKETDQETKISELMNTRLSYWGAKVIENKPEILQILGRDSVDRALDRIAEEVIGGTTLGEISGKLRAFSEHPKWSQLS